MAELKNYDVYLNGKGYMLARDNRGNLLSGAYAEKHSDPFMHYVSTEKRWAEVTFRFSDGAGAEKYDGSNRYRWGKNIDTRSGNLLRGPAMKWVHSDPVQNLPVADDAIAGLEISNAAGANEGFALRFQAGLTSTIDTVAVLVKRAPGRDYNGAGNFTVGIYADAAGPKPGAPVGSQGRGFTYVDYDAARMYGCQPWENDEYFWVFAAVNAAVTAGDYYWVGITNNQAYEIYWAGSTGDKGQTQAKWDGTNWAAHSNAGDFYFYIGWRNYLDRPVTDMLSFRGGDGIDRIYVTSGNKILSKIDAATTWTVARSPYTTLIQDIGVYNGLLYTAVGLGLDMEQFTGTTVTTAWTSILNERAIRFANHDGLFWKVGGVAGATGVSLLSGYDGSTWGATFQVGDPGTAITAMVSHGGKLYCAKEEGIYEITYEDTYPASGSVTANLVLDFSTDCALRPWILDWHGGLYFPGNNAVYEWKNGILRDIWNDRVDPDAQETTAAQGAEVPAYTMRKRNAPIATFPSRSRGVFHAAIGTTRGLFVSASGPHLYESQIWCYNLSGWHPMGPVVAKTGEDPLTAGYLARYLSAMYMRTLGPSEDRLYFAHGQGVGYFRLPGWTSDLSQYGDASYQAAWEVELPLFDGDNPKMKKFFHSVEIVTKNLSSNPYILVDYQLDPAPGDSQWSGAHVLKEGPVGEKDIDLVGNSLRLRLRGLYTHSTSTPLVVESVTLKYHMLPDTVSTYSLMLDLSATMEKAGGGVDQRTANTIAGELRDLLEKEWPWVFRDPTGARRRVMALTLDLRTTELMERAGQMGPPMNMLAAMSLIATNNTMNLITNGDFALNANGWELSAANGGTWLATDGYPAYGCVRWVDDSGMLGVAQQIAQTNISVTSAGTYTLRVRAKCTSTVTQGISVLLSEYDGSPMYLAQDFYMPVPNRWYTFTAEVNLPVNTLLLGILSGGFAGPGQYVYVDTVELVG